MSGIKRQRDIAACIYKMGRARTKQEYECTLQDFQALQLEAAEWFDKRHHLFARYVFLENRFRKFGVTTSNACAWPKSLFSDITMLPYHRQQRFDKAWQIYVTDPDGYVIELNEPKK